jgi:tryptophan-rich sensory protein
VSKLGGVALGAWELVVGEDWRTALGVVMAIALTALLAEVTVAAWLVMPVAVLLLLAMSVWRSVRGPLRGHDN